MESKLKIFPGLCLTLEFSVGVQELLPFWKGWARFQSPPALRKPLAGGSFISR